MKKKGSLSLSVNAIVILILAITMLGLGLGFIRGMFGKASSQFEQQVSLEPAPTVPSATDPITLSREMVITRGGETPVIKVAVFNPTSAPLPAVELQLTCIGFSANGKSNTRAIKVSEYQEFSMLITVPASVAGTHLCEISGKGTTLPATIPKEDITIKVTQ